MFTFFTQDWAPAVELASRQFITLCATIYCAGYVAGENLHRLNDWFAGIKPAPKMQPAVHPVVDLADSLSSLTVKELKALYGQRKGERKGDIIARILAY